MEHYRYCMVRLKDTERTFSYISDAEIDPGSFVVVPLGYKNRLQKGIVEDVGWYTEENAPWPVSKTKHIIREMTEAEYTAEEDAAWDHYAETFMGEMEELESLVREEDYDAVFEWACEHHDALDCPDIMEAVVRCYRLCVAHNHPGAALNLGTMYYNGTYLKRDWKEAVRLYEIAAAGGELRAICNLGYCYYYGRHQEPDYERAFRYFSLGASLYGDPNCLYKLGDLYREGHYVEQNAKCAVMFYFRALEMSARRDDGELYRADILMRVGREFMDGTIVERDVKKALDCFLQALSGFYDRRKTDPFVADLIEEAKEMIEEAEDLLDRETLDGDAG